MDQLPAIRKRLSIIIFVIFLMPVTTWAQKLKWVFPSINYIDLVDKSGNNYIADQAYQVEDIDPGPGVTNINGTMGGTFLVKYDSLFNLKWYKTSQLIEMNYSRSIMTNTNDNDLLILETNETDTFKAKDYFITKLTQDGDLIFTQKIFKITYGSGSRDNKMLDLFTDDKDNIWISGVVDGNIAFGTSGTNEAIPIVLPFIAKYNKNGDLIKVIRRNYDTYFGRNYNHNNYKIDTLGTIHQIILENGKYYYLTNTISGTIKKTFLFQPQNGSPSIYNLSLLNTDEFIIAGKFQDAFDFDNSANTKYLSPKGTSDVFIARYGTDCSLKGAWQIGGMGSVETIDDMIVKNNFLSVGVLSNSLSTVDFDMSTGDSIFNINKSVTWACYDLSAPIKTDSIIAGETNEDQVADVYFGPKGSYPMYLTNFQDTLYFVANVGSVGTEIWKTDGTQKGTKLVEDLTEDGGSFNIPISVNLNSPLIANNNTLFVIPDTLTYQNRLMKTSRSSIPFTSVSDQNISRKFKFKNSLYCPTDSSSFLVTDGTSAVTKTYSINNTKLDLDHIVYEDSVAYFIWQNNEASVIYKFNGDTFTSILTINKPIYGLEKFNGKFYFYELSSSLDRIPIRLAAIGQDGSGYMIIAGMEDNTTRNDQSYFFIKNIGNCIVFLGYDGTNNLELWRTDSAYNTQIIKDINPNGGLNVNNMVLSKQNILFFSADIGHGNDIFQTDGTPEGTTRLRGLNPFGKVNYNSMAIIKDVLYFGATNNSTGSELWKYKFVKNINLSEGSRNYSSDSLSFTCKLKSVLSPADATDTLLNYTIDNPTNYAISIDSLGNVNVSSIGNVNAISYKKSASVNSLAGTIGINVLAKDGSKTSTHYSLKLGTGVSTNVPDVTNKIQCFVSPNPAKDYITIDSNFPLTGTLNISDISGRILMVKSLDNVNHQNIDISSLPRGLLIVKIKSCNTERNFKVVHQ